jgi:hypothetical protein
VIATEIRDEDFYADISAQGFDLTNCFCEYPGSAIGQIVPVYRGDDRILQSHFLNRRSDPFRFFAIIRWRDTGLDGTETARSRTDFAQNHERGSAFTPTFAYIGTSCILAHGV